MKQTATKCLDMSQQPWFSQANKEELTDAKNKLADMLDIAEMTNKNQRTSHQHLVTCKKSKRNLLLQTLHYTGLQKKIFFAA